MSIDDYLRWPPLLYILIGLGLLFLMIIIVGMVKIYKYNPFSLPCIKIDIDVSGKRNPKYNDCIDAWINNLPEHRKNIEEEYSRAISEWEITCQKRIKKCVLWRTHRKKQYMEIYKNVVGSGEELFKFIFWCSKTTYYHYNDQRCPQISKEVDTIVRKSLQELLDIEKELSKSGYKKTRSQRFTEKQRSKVNSVKDIVKKRDNYTCQMCGKYMPDEVGLHIDHIIPVAQGGTTVVDNLQVLCDKCNLKKGQKNLSNLIQ